MPKFMDFHPDMQMSAESVARLRAETHSGTVDEFGVRQLELYYSPEAKGVYCLLEAPDEEAVRRHHGGDCGPVLRVESLL
jgi:quinol monooxygenase YgiN